jgi:formamidopyrimidine-DNA glycosylase
VIELPESLNLANQINSNIAGKRVCNIKAGHTPHKLAWYYGQPAQYFDLLIGKTVGKARGIGSLVEISLDKARVLFGEGANARFHNKNEARPAKHQLLIEFEDRSAISFSVQMYGGLGAFLEGELDNPYYKVAMEKPSPLSPDFDKAYFGRLIEDRSVQKLSLKALLATDQRIPGLGNGVLQDILFNAKMHPRKKVGYLSVKDHETLFSSVKTTLTAMTSQGGRDTEPDLFGRPGRYRTILSKNTLGKPCPLCGTLIKRDAYMGGNIYYCESCQTLSGKR